MEVMPVGIFAGEDPALGYRVSAGIVPCWTNLVITPEGVRDAEMVRSFLCHFHARIFARPASRNRRSKLGVCGAGSGLDARSHRLLYQVGKLGIAQYLDADALSFSFNSSSLSFCSFPWEDMSSSFGQRF